MKITVEFLLLSAMFVSYECVNSRLGTVLLQTDKIISRSLKKPEETTGEAVVQNLRIYIKSLRLLREYQEKRPNKRSTRLTEALVNQGRPQFLKYDIQSMSNSLKIDFDWTEEDMDAAIGMFKEAERLRDEIQRHYRRHVINV